MCTLIAMHRRIFGAPLVIAANRDEFMDRPSRGPSVRQAGAGPILAPLDLRAGGTWLGLNAHGLFAALTNRPCATPDPERRSRGQLVEEALQWETARQAAEMFRELPSAAYNPCNAFVADRDEAYTLVYEETPKVLKLAAGTHVIGNAEPDSRATPKLARVFESALQAERLPRDAVLGALADVCRRHEGSGSAMHDVCVHRGEYGTRSSALLLLGERDAGGQFFWAGGPPCETEYEDFTSLLHELSQKAGNRVGEAITRAAN